MIDCPNPPTATHAEVDTQETALSDDCIGVLEARQAVPFHSNAWPIAFPTATQKVGETQETDLTPASGETLIVAGADHDDPIQADETDLPASTPTAAQKVEEAHDTDTSVPPSRIVQCPDHEGLGFVHETSVAARRSAKSTARRGRGRTTVRASSHLGEGTARRRCLRGYAFQT
jgi:hypothetical protein